MLHIDSGKIDFHAETLRARFTSVLSGTKVFARAHSCIFRLAIQGYPMRVWHAHLSYHFMSPSYKAGLWKLILILCLDLGFGHREGVDVKRPPPRPHPIHPRHHLVTAAARPETGRTASFSSGVSLNGMVSI